MLAQPYTAAGADGARLFRERLGTECPELTRLSEAILADLDPEVFGIGWWAPHIGAKRRILIADCMYQAIESVDNSLTEARLHILQLRHWYDEENRQNADAVAVDPSTRKVRVVVEPPKSALDQLPSAMSTLHVVGTLQALNTSLDCLAGGIVGVCALPLDLQRASYGGVASFVEGRRSKPTETQKAFGRLIARRVSDNGPSGWLDWMRQFRNTNLHRGRRLNAKLITQRQPILSAPDGNVILRADTTSVLPAEPGFSEIEALLGRRLLQLTEPALTTLVGCLGSTRELVRAISSDLLEIWHKRRAHPEWLVQPDAQWLSVELPEATGFDGYEPGTTSSKIPTIVAHPSYTRRMQAAALETKNRHRWDDEFS